MDGVHTLVYVELDPTQKEALVGDDTREDEVGVTEEFVAWWQVELEEGDDEPEGRHVHQHVDIAGDVAIGVGASVGDDGCS